MTDAECRLCERHDWCHRCGNCLFCWPIDGGCACDGRADIPPAQRPFERGSDDAG